MKKYILLLVFLFLPLSKLFTFECKTYPIINGKVPGQLIIEDSYISSDIVFYGKYLGNRKFQIIKQFKGEKLKLISQTEIGLIYDYSFVKNENYLVYGNLDENNFLFRDICLPNRLIKKRRELKLITKYFKD